MSVEAFIAEYKRETTPLRVQPIHSYLAKGRRLAPGGKAEIALRAQESDVYIDWIGSLEGAKGQGSAALTWLCGLADRHNVTLKLKVNGGCTSIGVLREMNGNENQPVFTPRGLRAWYRRHGFKTVGRKRGIEFEFIYYDVYMSRAPRRKNKMPQQKAQAA